MKRGKAGDRREAEAAGAIDHPADGTAIARRAYELYLERGAEPGRDLEDWLRAEAELLPPLRP